MGCSCKNNNKTVNTANSAPANAITDRICVSADDGQVICVDQRAGETVEQAQRRALRTGEKR